MPNFNLLIRDIQRRYSQSHHRKQPQQHHLDGDLECSSRDQTQHNFEKSENMLNLGNSIIANILNLDPKKALTASWYTILELQ